MMASDPSKATAHRGYPNSRTWSALLKLVLFFVCCPAVTRAETNATSPTMERQILTQLYQESNGPQWIRQWGWLNESLHHCLWEGVGCANSSMSLDNTSVTSLHLAGNSLQGQLINLGSLSRLSVLDLSLNELEGSLQQVGIEALTELQYLDLSKNFLQGTLGTDISNLTALLFLDLSSNELEGTIGQVLNDPSLQIETLNLALNEFEGTLELGMLGLSLRVLDASRNPNVNGTLEDMGIFNLTFLEDIRLGGNSLDGTIDSLVNLTLVHTLDLEDNSFSGGLDGIANMTLLQDLNLARNKFAGTLPNLTAFESLEFLDLSENGNLTGNIDVAGISALSTLKSINLAGNKFNGNVGEEPIAFLDVQFLDLSRNRLSGQLADVRELEKLEFLDISVNRFNGTIPELGNLVSLKILNFSSNELTGTIPDLSRSTLLEQLDLSNQFLTYYDPGLEVRINQGLTGSIPDSLGQLVFLQEIVLFNNLLSGPIPEELARLDFLRVLNVESNQLSGQIPASLDLLQQLVVVALARNRLSGPIPPLGGSELVIRTVTLKDNEGLDSPAPFGLCDLEDIDLGDDDTYCPQERSGLVAFYKSTKGDDWNNNENWLNGNQHHCTWFGVECDSSQQSVLSLSLSRNGLSGPIAPELFTLTSLESIDFNDNEIRGIVPSEIGKLANLYKLRLSYNLLTAIPTTLGDLTKLVFLHLHGNRISGNDTYITVEEDATIEGHTFIADCGDPTDSLDPFVCENCDMCCNSLEECQEPGESLGTDQSVFAVIIILGVLLGVVGFGWFFSRKKRVLPLSGANAKESCGDDSVYCFIVSDSPIGWIIAAAVIGVQFSTFGLFLNAANLDASDSDVVYSWRCARNKEECDDDKDLSRYGWAIWGLLVFVTLLSDFANAIKLTYLSATRASLHAFVGSAVLWVVSYLAVYTSIEYNKAIALTSTELIVNAVILLFVNELDEQMFGAIQVIAPVWLDKILKQADARSARLLEDSGDDGNGDGQTASTSGVNQALAALVGASTPQNSKHGSGVRDKDSADSFHRTAEDNRDSLEKKLSQLEREILELRKAFEVGEINDGSSPVDHAGSPNSSSNQQATKTEALAVLARLSMADL